MRLMHEHLAFEVHGHRDNGEVFSIAALGRLPETEALAFAQQYVDRWDAPVSLCRVPFVDIVTPRGFAGPSLLAMILFEKFGQHQPLNRQSERYAREGIELSLSTLADQVRRQSPTPSIRV
jgi:transposase